MRNLKNRTGWIWLNNWNETADIKPQIVYFRKVIQLETLPDQLILQLSADSKYKLYINGNLITYGPQKGDRSIWYYDELDITAYLKQGDNVIVAAVVRYPNLHHQGNHSIYRTHTPGFYLKGFTDNQMNCCFKADDTWKAYLSKVELIAENSYFAPLYIQEIAYGEQALTQMMTAQFDDSSWHEVVEYDMFQLADIIKPDSLQKRSIPLMFMKTCRFDGIFHMINHQNSEQNWNRMLQADIPIVIPPNSEEIVEISAGKEMTGFLELAMMGGGKSEIRILSSECYAYEPEGEGPGYMPLKGDRTDYINGKLYGFTDIYQVLGIGEEDHPEKYEPFWFRTFRFIRLAIKTDSEQLILKHFKYMQTGYPLKIETKVDTSDTTLGKIWEISAHTLQCCMHETYEDCPFYEQLQYAMDSRSQILYTYAVSADDRLARQCMDDFRRAVRQDGMINCSYPNYEMNVIPGFSIYYIGMVYDHMMYFGDRVLVRKHVPTILGILQFFKSNVNDIGIVGKIGGPNLREHYWSFIDWTKEWNETMGVPLATYQGPITMESLLYLLGLQYAEALFRFIGYQDLADECFSDSEKMKQAINQYCRGENGMLQDGPALEQYSQHCQVFGIITGTIGILEGKQYLTETLENPELYAQCSVAMMYYLFRALELCGMYSYTNTLWNLWRDMVAKKLTTCEEDAVNSRSDCHAWGALILYELPSVILGVKPIAPGYSKISISPNTDYLSWAKGSVITPKGMLTLEWKLERENYMVQAAVPKEIEVVFHDIPKNMKVEIQFI
ncbi:MAG TPA: alpha-L-rhamnosidase C-terminal domain-containing protein [Mobilitalea sp.]|nr:alpha-L-rhamnosidase C-terminal domain-containing protein [Mobilitalea sp.]